MSNFHVKQEVVSLKTFSDTPLKKGNIEQIEGIKLSSCGCGDFVLVNVGHLADTGLIGVYTVCAGCGQNEGVSDGYWWYNANYFVPLQTASEESDMEQSIKEAFEKELFEI